MTIVVASRWLVAFVTATWYDLTPGGVRAATAARQTREAVHPTAQ